MAIMGSSGAGKTTLLDVLAGRNKTGEVQGDILINGEYKPGTLERISGYVMQDEAFVETLTVRETLYYALLFKSPIKRSSQEIDSIIDDVLHVLNMKRIEHNKIGDPLKRGISGGERRRLAIGVELVLRPAILFLDEPTTGLDAQNALRVVNTLRTLCHKYGHTIITTIHQPRSNIFKMFDQLLILWEGKTVYCGPASQTVPYFSRVGFNCPETLNPADYLMDMLEEEEEEEAGPDHHGDGEDLGKKRKQSVEKLPMLFRKSKEHEFIMNYHPARSEDGSTIVIHQPPSLLHQFLTLSSRTWKSTLRDKSVFYFRIGAALLMGLLVGGIFFRLEDTPATSGGKINTMLFLMCAFSLFCVPAISKFIKEKLLFTRERASGYYSTTAYFFSSLSVEIPILMIIVFGYGCISYWMVGFEPHTANFVYFLVLIFVVINVGFSISQLLSSATKSATLAIAIYMIILVYSLLLGGFIVRKSQLPHFASWAIYTSYFWYGFQGLILNEFKDKSYGPDVIKSLDMGGSDKFQNLYALVGFWVVLQVIVYIILHYFNKEKR
uniref:ABC transporter domain-containing protein n=1 Tax=Arcella intermedia TaxID=1963864 RepID=A0A6B2L0Z9_9EUKA